MIKIPPEIKTQFDALLIQKAILKGLHSDYRKRRDRKQIEIIIITACLPLII